MARDDSSDREKELAMARAQVAELEQRNAQLEQRCEALRSIAMVAMAELTEVQMGRVRAMLAKSDAGQEGGDAPSG
jgi:hypothetical protein